MFKSFAASHMNMKADIYILQSQQTDSGVFERKWIYSKTVECRAEALETLRGGKVIASSPDGFYDQLTVKFKTMEPVSRRSRITNIRTNDGKIVYPELDRIEPISTIFEIKQSHASVDPFGRISYYETLLKRAVVQENDIYSN